MERMDDQFSLVSNLPVWLSRIESLDKVRLAGNHLSQVDIAGGEIVASGWWMSPDVDGRKPLAGAPLPRSRPYHLQLYLNYLLCQIEQARKTSCDRYRDDVEGISIFSSFFSSWKCEIMIDRDRFIEELGMTGEELTE